MDFEDCISRLGLNVQFSPMGFHDVMGNAQAQPRSIRSFLRREEGLQDFIPNLFRNSATIV
jgi:hypothetical protein